MSEPICSEMAWRIARAIHEVVYPNEIQGEHWAGAATVEGMTCVQAAMAVLDVMREPTDAMLHKYDDLNGSYTGFWASDSKTIKEGWQAMIDVALFKPLSSPISYTMEAETGRFENEGSALK